MLTKEKINGHISILIGIIFLIALFASAQTVAAKKTVRIILPKAPHTTHLGDLVGDFEKKTGIKAKVDYFPEVPYMTKVKMLMATESDEYDVVYCYVSIWLSLSSI